MLRVLFVDVANCGSHHLDVSARIGRLDVPNKFCLHHILVYN
jgi:hypothetical protein